MTRKSENGLSAIDRIRQLDEERAKLAEEAKAQALEQANEAVELLNSLGYSYRFIQEGRPKSVRKNVPHVKGGPCPICNFETKPSHDGRKHRTQGGNKMAFTDSELEQLGLVRA